MRIGLCLTNLVRARAYTCCTLLSCICICTFFLLLQLCSCTLHLHLLHLLLVPAEPPSSLLPSVLSHPLPPTGGHRPLLNPIDLSTTDHAPLPHTKPSAILLPPPRLKLLSTAYLFPSLPYYPKTPTPSSIFLFLLLPIPQPTPLSPLPQPPIQHLHSFLGKNSVDSLVNSSLLPGPFRPLSFICFVFLRPTRNHSFCGPSHVPFFVQLYSAPRSLQPAGSGFSTVLTRQTSPLYKSVQSLQTIPPHTSDTPGSRCHPPRPFQYSTIPCSARTLRDNIHSPTSLDPLNRRYRQL